MFPANQHVSRTVILRNGLSDSAGVVAVDFVVEVDAVRFEGFGEWAHGEIWTILAAVFVVGPPFSQHLCSEEALRSGGIKKSLEGERRESALTVLRMLRDDVPNIILTLAAKDLDKRLGAINTQSRQAVLVVAVGELGWFLAVTDEVDCRRSRLGRLMVVRLLSTNKSERLMSLALPFSPS